MAHFAEMENNVVKQVIVISNENCGDKEFPESEPIGQAYISSIGIVGYFLQTSYSNSFRGVYAGEGYTYDPDLDIFIEPPIEEETE
jgi:hypothetical protein